MVQSETLCLQRLGKYKEEIQRGSPCASQEAQCFTSFKSFHLHSDPMRKEPLLSPPTDEQTGSERLLRVTRVVAGGSARLGPSHYPTLAQWEAGAQEMAGLSTRWFLTGSGESRSSLPIPCTPPTQSQEQNQAFYCCPWGGKPGFPSLFPPPLPEVSSGVDGGWGWRAGLGKGNEAAAAALGRALGWRKTGMRDLPGGLFPSKAPRAASEAGPALVLGEKPALPGPEPSDGMGASALPVPGGQGHGVEGPQTQSLIHVHPVAGPSTHPL